MFSEGEAYERFMGRWSRRLARAFVQFAGVAGNDHALDVGCGTGALTVAIKKAAPASWVIGIDPSSGYVGVARARQLTEGVAFEVGDAQRMRFHDASFNRALSLLVLNFVPDRRRAVSEMVRVTRPGGTVAAAVWEYGGRMELLRVFWDEAVQLAPAIATLDERHMPLCRPGELAALWGAHGLTDVTEEALVIETRFTSFDDYWTPFLERQGPAGAYVATLSDDAREQLRRRLRQRLIGDEPDRPILLEARAWAVRGTVPR